MSNKCVIGIFGSQTIFYLGGYSIFVFLPYLCLGGDGHIFREDTYSLNVFLGLGEPEKGKDPICEGHRFK